LFIVLLRLAETLVTLLRHARHGRDGDRASDTSRKTVVERLAVGPVPQHRTPTLVLAHPVQTDPTVVALHRLTFVYYVQLTLGPRCTVRTYALVPGVGWAARAAVLTRIAVADHVRKLTLVSGVALLMTNTQIQMSQNL